MPVLDGHDLRSGEHFVDLGEAGSPLVGIQRTEASGLGLVSLPRTMRG